MTKASPERYNSVAIILHWTIALLVIGQLAGGLIMTKLPKDLLELKFQMIQLHKSFGITILLLTFIRLGWRLAHKAPPFPAVMSKWEKLAARSVHVLFYVLLIVTPLLGWAVVSSSPLAKTVHTYLFGVVYWPHMPFFDGVADRKALSHEIAEFHEKAAFIMIGLIVLHVSAALKHHFFNHDRVLSNMLPFVRSRA